jgi:hypothetical protein
VGEGEVLRAVVAAIGGVDNGKWLEGHGGGSGGDLVCLLWLVWLVMLWAGLEVGKWRGRRAELNTLSTVKVKRHELEHSIYF